MIIMGVDPGVTTGIAIYIDDDYHGWEMRSYQDAVELINIYQPEVIVIENFLVRHGKPSIYHPSIRMIGVMEYICQERDIKYVIQSPSILKAILPIVPDTIKSPHIRSATAHIIYYLSKQAQRQKS